MEDAAQGITSRYKGAHLGGIGHLGALSFHATKNIISGEGGVLLVNDPQHAKRAEIIREKGTNRSQFFRGEVDKYTWMDVGSSYLPSEVTAAFLWAQLEAVEAIQARRLAIWDQYYAGFADLEAQGMVRRPQIPPECEHNGHIFHLLFRDLAHRTEVQDKLREVGIQTTFHFVPLHNSPAGQRFGRAQGDLPLTVEISERLLRLPLWKGLADDEVERVIEAVCRFA
jgi:dTDP-4-amino-4,6-dideoxygalactose transaminase